MGFFLDRVMSHGSMGMFGTGSVWMFGSMGIFVFGWVAVSGLVAMAMFSSKCVCAPVPPML